MDESVMVCINYKDIEFFLSDFLIRYRLLVWGGAYSIHLKPLKVIQNYIVTVMVRKPAATIKSTRCIMKNCYVSLVTYNLVIYVKIIKSLDLKCFSVILDIF